MSELQALANIWPTVFGIVALIAWAVRLESKVQFLTRDNHTLSKKHDALDKQVLEELASVRESLARIEGRLSVGKHDEAFS